MSEHLGRRLKELVTVLGGVLPQDRSAEVMYFLQELQQNMTMQGPAILVLAEFSVMHPFAFESIAEVLLNGLAQEITPENSSLIEACIFGLHSVCSSSVDKFKLLVQKMIARSTINEGDLMALYYLLDSLKDIQPSKITDLLRKFMPAIGNQRHTLKKRLFAIYVSVELAAVLGADEMARVLDAVQTFLDSLIDEEDYENKVYSCLGRILEHLGPKHSLFKTLISTAKKVLFFYLHKIATSIVDISLVESFAARLKHASPVTPHNPDLCPVLDNRRLGWIPDSLSCRPKQDCPAESTRILGAGGRFRIHQYGVANQYWQKTCRDEIR